MPTDLPGAVRRREPAGVVRVLGEAARRGFGSDGLDWANFGQGAPETGALPGAPARLTRADFPTDQHEYAPLGGDPLLREAVAALYNARYRRGRASRYTADNVAVCAGGRLALARILAACEAVPVGFLPPDYTAYQGLIETVGSVRPVALEDEALHDPARSVAALRAAVESAGLRAVLVSNPVNPTGQVRTGEELAGWCAAARALDCALVLDEFYAHYVYDGDGPVSAAAHVDEVDRDPVLICDGLTKNWRYPGLRVAWTVGPKAVIEQLIAVAAFLDGGCTRPMQRAVLPLLAPDAADAEAAAIRRVFAGKRTAVLDGLRALGVRVPREPAGSFYVWGEVSGLPDGWNDGDAFLARALDQRVIAIPGSAFDIDPRGVRSDRVGGYDRFLRFSFGPELGGLQAGLERLRASLR